MAILMTTLKDKNIKLFVPATCIYLFFMLFNDIQCLTFMDKQKYDKDLQVETDNGVVQGFRRQMENEKYVFIYRGIPFALPPLYNLRFMSPQPHSNWSGVLDTTLPTPSCVEFHFRLTEFSSSGSEDCLYLNVYSHMRPRDNKKFPVLFWIYGGAFVEGNTSYYDPEFFIEENLVVVTSNYRLGMFGFLSTEDEASPGNYGLKDQNAALKWVRNNIKNFGGDPHRVTIMGQSAGAACAIYHMLSPKSKGLFHGVIAMSGDTLTSWSYQRYPRNIASDISLHMGLSMENSTAFIEVLRQMDSDTLIRSQITPILVNLVQLYQNGLVFTPVIEYNHEDAFITEASYTLLEHGKFAKIPLIIGATSMEFNLFSEVIPLLSPLLLLLDLSPSLIPSRMNIPYLSDRRFVGNEIRKRYFRSESFMSATNEELLQYISDLLFVKPIQKSARLIAKYVPVFFYVFDYEGQAAIDFLRSQHYHLIKRAKGTGHAEDLAYIWKGFDLNEKDKLVSRRVVRMWSNFVKYGDPTPVLDELLQNVTWPPIMSNSVNYLHIGENLTILQNYRNSYMKFWEELYEKYCQKPFFIY